MNALYISHNGMLEGLGQAQVLPYLRGLAKRGVRFDLFSYELAETKDEEIAALRESLRPQGITWTALRRKRDPRIRVKVMESAEGALTALYAALKKRPRVVHGRSYLPTAICDVVATLTPGAKLLFDCRGMLGDEYVDAGHWREASLEYRLVKGFESRVLHRADGVVVLTDALRSWLRLRGKLDGPEVEVIPCCVDMEKFQFDASARARIRKELGVDDHVVGVYSGSLGSWYREAEIARFAGLIAARAKRAGKAFTFLLLTRSPPEELMGMLANEGVSTVMKRLSPGEMPAYLSACDAGIPFIKSVFSKMGSSPTKVAEYLACGLPVALNGDIGDQADLEVEKNGCVVLADFTDAAMSDAADAVLALATRPLAQRVHDTRAIAERRFGLETVGVPRYERLYRKLAS